MLRRMQVSNFRSLVQSQLMFEENYTCLVGANNVGKSNVITALKWLLSPQSLSSKGLPNVDLSRTSTSRTVSICASIDNDTGLSDNDFGFQIDQDGLIHIGRNFEFQGRDEEQNHILFTDYAKPSPLPVGLGMVLALLIFGWMIGLISGGFKYIKLLLHYRKTVKTVSEAEEFIRQFVAA